MAESAVQREGENESRLRRERLASSRLPDFNPPSEPIAAQQTAAPAGTHAGDQAAGGMARQQRLENQLNRQRRQEQKPEREEKGGGGPSLRDAAKLAKASPAGMAAGLALKGAANQGLPIKDIQRGIGRGCIMSLWNSLWLTFGHTIYFIAILFFIAWSSKYARKYIPEVGEEWFPAELAKKIPKAALIPLKLGEIVGILFILFWVLVIDLACIGLFGLILGVIVSAKNFIG